MSSPLPHDKSVSIDKPESSNGDQEDKKLKQMSSFAREFYSCDEPESSNAHQEDNKFYKMGSFAREFYISHYVSEPDAQGEALKVARARHRMEYLTDSQWVVLGEQLGSEIGEGEGEGVIDKVLAWRKKRGDFFDDDDDDDDDDERWAFLGDVEEVPQLPSDMKDVSGNTLLLGFLKSDLQCECLLNNIPYEGSDSKAQLISKLMHFKNTLFCSANTFQILEEQCITSTCRGTDEGGILNDVVESNTLDGELPPTVAKAKHQMEYSTDTQWAAEIGEGAAPSMVDAWRKKTGGFHDDDDDEEDDEDYDYDYDDDEEEDEQEVPGDEVRQPISCNLNASTPTPSKFI